MKPYSRINEIKSAAVVVSMAVILFASANSSAQTYVTHSAGIWHQSPRDQIRPYATPVVPYQRLHSPFPYRDPKGPVDRYKSNYGEYGYSHYGPVPGVYGNHFGYYRRPYVRWSPHYGWTHLGSRRH